MGGFSLGMEAAAVIAFLRKRVLHPKSQYPGLEVMMYPLVSYRTYEERRGWHSDDNNCNFGADAP